MIASALLGLAIGVWGISRRHIACYFFGHRPAFGYGHSEGQGYFEITPCGVDGINRHHASLHCECERCGVKYHVGKIHIPYQYVRALDEKVIREAPFHL